jgi:hypothetical protein
LYQAVEGCPDLAKPCFGQAVGGDCTEIVLRWHVNKAYQIVFKCPKSGHNINLQKKSAQASLSESEAMKMFGNEEISCSDPHCRWQGKASRTELLRIVPFTWILSPAT